jgi:hypothetical protein
MNNEDEEFYFPIWTPLESIPARSVDIIQCIEKIESMKKYQALMLQYIKTFEKKKLDAEQDQSAQSQKNVELYNILIKQFTQIHKMMIGDEEAYQNYVPSAKDIKVLKCIEDQINAKKMGS